MKNTAQVLMNSVNAMNKNILRVIKLLPMLFFMVGISSCSKKSALPVLEIYAQVPYAVGNIAYNANGELVYSNHPFYSPAIRVMQYDEKTKTSRPFPNTEWNTENKDPHKYLSSVLGIRNDSKGNIWMLDMGFRNNITPKFVAWDTKNNVLHKIIDIPSPASIASSQLNDFVIDEDKQVMVIADEEIGPGGDGSKAALVIVDINSGKSRRVLEGHYSTKPENVAIRINKRTLNIPGTNKPILVGADGITLDKDNKWLYYCPLNGSRVYRVEMKYLVDESVSPSELGERVEVYSNKEHNGGLSMDVDGNIYLSNLASNSIGIIPAETKKPTILIHDEALLWPDGVSYNKDGYMYTGAAQLHLSAAFNNGVDKTSGKFFIYRFKPLAEGIFGR